MPIRIDVLLFVHGLSDNDVEAPNARRNLTHFSFGPPGLVRRLSFGHVERQSSTPPLFSTWSTPWLRRTRTWPKIQSKIQTQFRWRDWVRKKLLSSLGTTSAAVIVRRLPTLAPVSWLSHPRFKERWSQWSRDCQKILPMSKPPVWLTPLWWPWSTVIALSTIIHSKMHMGACAAWSWIRYWSSTPKLLYRLGRKAKIALSTSRSHRRAPKSVVIQGRVELWFFQRLAALPRRCWKRWSARVKSAVERCERSLAGSEVWRGSIIRSRSLVRK